jgi:hypothetical protein
VCLSDSSVSKLHFMCSSDFSHSRETDCHSCEHRHNSVNIFRMERVFQRKDNSKLIHLILMD